MCVNDAQGCQKPFRFEGAQVSRVKDSNKQIKGICKKGGILANFLGSVVPLFMCR